MPASQFAGIRTPAGSQKVAVPADMMVMADDIDTKVFLPAENANDRNTRYSDVPAGTHVVSTDGLWEWVKTSDPPNAPTWVTLRSSESTTAFTWSDGWSDTGGSILTRNGDHDYELHVQATYSGDGFGPGNVVNIAVLTLPTGWRPKWLQPAAGLVQLSFGLFAGIQPSGVLNIYDLPGGSAVSDGQYIHFYANWKNL